MDYMDMGLLVIVIAWVYQWNAMRAGKRQLEPVFALLYGIGVLMLIISDGLSGTYAVSSILHVLTLLVAAGVCMHAFKIK